MIQKISIFFLNNNVSLTEFFPAFSRSFWGKSCSLVRIDALNFNIFTMGETDFLISKSLKNSSSILIDTEKCVDFFFGLNWKHSFFSFLAVKVSEQLHFAAGYCSWHFSHSPRWNHPVRQDMLNDTPWELKMNRLTFDEKNILAIQNWKHFKAFQWILFSNAIRDCFPPNQSKLKTTSLWHIKNYIHPPAKPLRMYLTILFPFPTKNFVKKFP